MTATSSTGTRRRLRMPRNRWMRRLAYASIAAALVVVAVLVAGGWFYARAALDTFGEQRFEQPLHVPPVLEARLDDEGRKVFDLDLEAGTTELVPGVETETWGANGSYLGPTVRASRGDEVVMRVANDLPEPTTLHWHGMHLPAAADGNPHQLIEPGETWSPSWTIDQPAASLWYHPHPHGDTAEHVYRGIAGMFLIDDEETTALPDDYGVDDIPVILQDKRFHDDGALDFDEPLLSTVGQLGDEMLVNGTHDPHLVVTRERTRLRVLNASNGRVYNLGFDDDRPFQLIGTDGGLLTGPVELRRLQVSPGERVEIVVALGAGEETVLRSYPPDIGLDFVQARFSGGDDRLDLLQLRAVDTLEGSPPVPSRLATDELPREDEAALTRDFTLTGRSRINGEAMDMSRIDTTVAVDTTEIWEVTNLSGNPHNFHVHDVQFRLVDRNGEPPPPQLDGPKDTVFIPPNRTVRLALRFTDYTDADVPYMYHCHVLAHEDAGMMAQFTVVEADELEEAPDTVDTTPNDAQHQGNDP